MLRRVVALAPQLAEAAGSVVGLRLGTEEPGYTRERVAAETTVFADEESARSAGFRRLAGYIFGGNDGDGAVIRFFGPAGRTVANLPAPDDNAVTPVTVPTETVAARTTELLDTLRDNPFHPTGTPIAWFYDPPWTIPFRRRNEIAVPVAPR
jgi:hypothetical protein